MKKLFLLSLFIPISALILAQPRADSLNSALDKANGKEKLILLHKLTQEYFDGNDTKKALKIARQATTLADRIIVIENELITEEDHVLKATFQELFSAGNSSLIGTPPLRSY